MNEIWKELSENDVDKCEIISKSSLFRSEYDFIGNQVDLLVYRKSSF